MQGETSTGLLTPYDALVEVLPDSLWQSGCYVRRADLPDDLNVIVTVGDAAIPREGNGEPWTPDWSWDLERVEPGRPHRPIHLRAPLIDTHRAGFLDVPAADAVAQCVASLLLTGRKALVHCDGGHFRSVFMAALIVHYATGMGGWRALEWVRERQNRHRNDPGILPEMDAMLRSLMPANPASPEPASPETRTANEENMGEQNESRVRLTGRGDAAEPSSPAPTTATLPDGQHADHWILSDEERAKGFVRPVRTSYRHEVCGTVTTMPLKIGETYAAQPHFYGATFCCGCRAYLPVGATGQFVWLDDGSKVGT